MSTENKDNTEKPELVLREEATLQFWKENNIFEKSLEKNKDKESYVFYDGPPFATGLPHWGSLLSSVVKDVFPRYHTMKGKYVRRRWGWDCHGLPIENMIEKEMGIGHKKEIEDKIGIETFNEACRSAVLQYATDWEKYVDRIARWTEFSNAYKTMDNSYMESVWHFVKQMHEKNFLYEGRKVLLYCPHCQTPLSKAEIAMDNSYKDIDEESVTISFVLTNPEQASLPAGTRVLAWTTTPWTLPGNVGLAVGYDVEYAVVKQGDDHFVLAKDLVEVNFKDGAEVVSTMFGKDLENLEYQPLYTIDKIDQGDKKGHYIMTADFVTTEDGTGVVHTAVIYGEDDYNLGLEKDLPMVPLLDAAGHFTGDAPELVQGEYFKKAEKAIKNDLAERGLLFAKKNHRHSYPHCYRCDTALLYNAISSWFVDVQTKKDRIVELNNDINWEPENLKHGRFGNILESAPDWTISRNRYWATPLPIWRHPTSDELVVVGSLAELKDRTRSDNTFVFIRHGETVANKEWRVSVKPGTDIDVLTEEGRAQVENSVAETEELLGGKPDVIIASPFVRTQETAKILAESFGVAESDIVTDDRIRERYFADGVDGRPYADYHAELDAARGDNPDPDFCLPGGETYTDVKVRVMDFMYEIDQKYQGKKVLVVTHYSPYWLGFAGAEGMDTPGAFGLREEWGTPQNAKPRLLDFAPVPHNDRHELDLHRPYIDQVTLRAEDGTELQRIPEVIDCWAESGSMPFAEQHYPFENKEAFEQNFPSDFISEYIAQTRTWFYYMHTVSALLFDNVSFKNVMTTGNVLAEGGAKMSKSKLNYTDPLELMDVMGADAPRFYMMASVVMQAEDTAFKDEEVKEVQNKLLNTLSNSLAFYQLFAGESHDVAPADSPNVLDQWVLARLNETGQKVTASLDRYQTPPACREILDFVGDLSRWFIRRSRDRFKGGDAGDKAYALATTRFALEQTALMLAPLTPYISEHIYQSVGGAEESVHLADWPTFADAHETVLGEMKQTRDLVSAGLEARASAKIKVRQPLASVTLKSVELGDQLTEIIRDELNVKAVKYDEGQEETAVLDTALTDDLQQEGDFRELLRQVQSMRKAVGLEPADNIRLVVQTTDKGQEMITAFRAELEKVAGVSEMEFADVEGDTQKANENRIHRANRKTIKYRGKTSVVQSIRATEVQPWRVVGKVGPLWCWPGVRVSHGESNFFRGPTSIPHQRSDLFKTTEARLM